MYTVDIDVGGTLTDGIFSGPGGWIYVKVDTTPHDLTVCFFECLSEGAKKLGFTNLRDFLEQVELIRWSTTITSNVLAERRGPKIGLIVSSGYEKNLYGTRESPAVRAIIQEQNIIGIDRVESHEEILNAVRRLLENGVRRICVSLKGAFHNPQNERSIKAIIDEQYPDHFLGSVPVLTGSEICENPDDMTRTHYALINAYTHGSLAATLFKAEDELRYSYGYSRPFLISHINGGVAGISKTKAISTIESGPILGLYGSSYFAKAYGLEKVIALDVGGTTAKIGVILGGAPVHSRRADIFDIPLESSLPYLRSIALGGGSVVKLGSGARAIALGPESMGSYPGPACYDLGGDKPTLTDAFVAAGLINPEHFLGGARRLNRELAVKAIEGAIAAPLGLSLQKACREILDCAYNSIAGMIKGALEELRQTANGFALFAYGGNGGLLGCGVAERVGLENIHIFSLGPVFSAFGSSISDLCHVYEKYVQIEFKPKLDLDRLNRNMDDMIAQGLRDMQAESIPDGRVEFSVELELRDANRNTLAIQFPYRRFGSEAEAHEILKRCSPTASPDCRGESYIEIIRLKALQRIGRPPLGEKGLARSRAALVPIGCRDIALGDAGQRAEIYKWESLLPGDVVRGCAIAEADNTTYFVPRGWALTVDKYQNGIIRREQAI